MRVRGSKRYFAVRFLLAFGLFGAQLSGCSFLKEKEQSDPLMERAFDTSKPLPPEKASELAEEVGSNWLYGQGIGETALTAGTCVLFPPFLAVVAGNAALSLSGYEPVTISGLLPEEEGKAWSDSYDSITSAPGRFAAAAAGKEFRTQDIIKDRYQQFLNDGDDGGRAQPNLVNQ